MSNQDDMDQSKADESSCIESQPDGVGNAGVEEQDAAGAQNELAAKVEGRGKEPDIRAGIGFVIVVALVVLFICTSYNSKSDDDKVYSRSRAAATTQAVTDSGPKTFDGWELDKEVTYQGVDFKIGSKWDVVDGLAADSSNTTGHVLYRVPRYDPVYVELMTSVEGKAKFPNNAIVKTGTLFALDTHYNKSKNGESLESWYVWPEDSSNPVINCACLITNDPDTGHGYMILVKAAPGAYAFAGIRNLLIDVCKEVNITPDDMTVGYEEGFEKAIAVPDPPAKSPVTVTGTGQSATPTAPAPVTTTPVSTTPKSTGTRVTDQSLQGTLLANAKAIVKDHLKGPSSAKFSSLFDDYNFIDQGSSSKHYGYETYRISGSVEAINSFNAMLKSNWVVVLDYDKDTGKYYEVSCDISE